MAVPRGSLLERLYQKPFDFDFFQAVRLLDMVSDNDFPVGGIMAPWQESVRFRSHVSLSFPPSALWKLEPPAVPDSPHSMSITFMGLLGAVGTMPRHYTELVLRHEREHRGAESGALRAWFDLFNHRLVSLFYRAWSKYRFWLAFDAGGPMLLEPDTFSRAVYSLVGLGSPGLRKRMQVWGDWQNDDGDKAVLARIDDQAVIFYGGLFAPRVHNALSLESMLEDFLGIPVEVKQFQGQWLELDNDNRSYLGEARTNNMLGANAVAGQRVWDVQGRIRITLGPLDYQQFQMFLPDESMTPEGKTSKLLLHLIRLYVGPEISVELQPILKPDATPECQLPASNDPGPQLGWSTWLFSQSFGQEVTDTVFAETMV